MMLRIFEKGEKVNIIFPQPDKVGADGSVVVIGIRLGRRNEKVQVA